MRSMSVIKRWPDIKRACKCVRQRVRKRSRAAMSNGSVIVKLCACMTTLLAIPGTRCRAFPNHPWMKNASVDDSSTRGDVYSAYGEIKSKRQAAVSGCRGLARISAWWVKPRVWPAPAPPTALRKQARTSRRAGSHLRIAAHVIMVQPPVLGMPSPKHRKP